MGRLGLMSTLKLGAHGPPSQGQSEAQQVSPGGAAGGSILREKGAFLKLPALGIALTYLFMVALYGIGLLPADLVDALRGEGGMVETPGEFVFLIASVAFLVAYGKSLGRGSDLGFVRFRRNVFYLMLGLLFFVCLGEEISWGQHLFGWQTPDVIRDLNLNVTKTAAVVIDSGPQNTVRFGAGPLRFGSQVVARRIDVFGPFRAVMAARIGTWVARDCHIRVNYQEETNLHNMGVFHPRNPDGTDRSFLSSLLTLNRMFAIFTLLSCVLTPLAARLSPRLRRFLMKIEFPLTPAWISGLFLTNFVLIFLLKDLNTLHAEDVVYETLNELKESLFAVAFAILGVQQLRRTAALRRCDASRSARRV